MQVNMSLREELDTRLTSWFQYKTAKENHDLMQKKVLMDLQQRRIKVGGPDGEPEKVRGLEAGDSEGN